MRSVHVLIGMVGFCASALSIADTGSTDVPQAHELQIASYIPPAKTDFSAHRLQEPVSIKTVRSEARPRREHTKAETHSTTQASVSQEEQKQMARLREAELVRATERLREVTRSFGRLRARGY